MVAADDEHGTDNLGRINQRKVYAEANLTQCWRRSKLETVEARFGGYRALEHAEMLSDNGSPYTARETRIFARQLGLKPCFTPVKSPQSNSISEAFVNTLKRDYVRVTPLPDAKAILGLIAGWFEDDTESHQH